jgi:molybdenum cofactor biosynthesis enzyme
MIKSVDPAAVLGDIRLIEKTGASAGIGLQTHLSPQSADTRS